MSIPTLATVRAEIVTALSGISGLQVYSRRPHTPPAPQAAWLMPASSETLTAAVAGERWTFDLVVQVSAATEDGQDYLDELVQLPGARSIRTALWSTDSSGGPPIGAILQSANVTSYAGPVDSGYGDHQVFEAVISLVFALGV